MVSCISIVSIVVEFQPTIHVIRIKCNPSKMCAQLSAFEVVGIVVVVSVVVGE